MILVEIEILHALVIGHELAHLEFTKLSKELMLSTVGALHSVSEVKVDLSYY